MITVAGREMRASDFSTGFRGSSVEKEIINTLISSGRQYSYDSAEQLEFELKLRREIVVSSYDLNKSGLRFEVFRKTFCNPFYWNRTQDGGFSLKSNVRPSDAILDIYRNGQKYGTECATAMMAVYYKALLNVYSEKLFNKVFPRIELMNWHRIDRLLKDVGYMQRRDDYLPGDRRYFSNPDVNPLTPEWQGENVIDLGGGLYYGHGIGIRRADSIIAELNQNRSRNADEYARLVDSAGRPDFKRLALAR